MHNFIIYLSNGGPGFKEEQITLLSSALGNEYSVKVFMANDFNDSKHLLNSGSIVWCYFRGTPSAAEDVLNKLENPNIKIINDYRKSDISNKWMNYELCRVNGLGIPRTYEVPASGDVAPVTSSLSYPIVVKGYPSGQGRDVVLCSTPYDANEASRAMQLKGLKVLAQEYIAESHGFDLRVLFVANSISASIRRHAADRDFRANISQGGSFQPYELSAEEEGYVRKVRLLFGIEICGFDFLFSKRGLLFNEINAAPLWLSGFDISSDVVRELL